MLGQTFGPEVDLRSRLIAFSITIVVLTSTLAAEAETTACEVPLFGVRPSPEEQLQK